MKNALIRNRTVVTSRGGISGCQSLSNVMLDKSLRERGMSLQRVSANVGERFRLSGKGRVEVVMDADFAFVNLTRKFNLRGADLLHRHKTSPYVGWEFRGEIVRAMIRGTTAFEVEKVVSKPVGRFKTEVKGSA